MHGPHALASTVAPIASRSASRPSRSIVARTCSEPGVTSSCVLARRPCAAAYARDRRGARDVLVRRVGARTDERGRDLGRARRCARAHAPTSPTSCTRSGVSGPLMSGVKRREVDLDHLVEEALGVGLDFGIGTQIVAHRFAASASSSRRVAFRYAAVCSSYGNSEVVAPISGAHVADRRLARSRSMESRAGAEVLDDRAGAPAHGEQAGDAQDHVLRRRPTRQRAREVHADQLRPAHVERGARSSRRARRHRPRRPRSCRGRPRSACGCRCRSSSRPGTRSSRARPGG